MVDDTLNFIEASAENHCTEKKLFFQSLTTMHIKVKIVALLSWLPLIPVAESSFANPHDLRYVLFICGKLVRVALSKNTF